MDEKNTTVEDSIVGFGVENVLENGAGAFEFGQSLHSLRCFIAKIQQTAWENDGQSLSRIFIFGTIFKSFDQRLKIEWEKKSLNDKSLGMNVVISLKKIVQHWIAHGEH